ncbi:MAG: hypothetical protein KJI71_01760 [Patescibacteria group bacterium]|nr:hypothetical protein [Patescibacteria group bacterium]
MPRFATKHYPPIADNNFIVSGYDVPLYTSSPLVIHDKDGESLRRQSIKSHIRSDDYFGTLATIIDLITQQKEKIEGTQNKILRNLKKDLVYLQKNYKIVKKK